MSTENHVNESILNDEIREFQKKNRIDHMKYLPDMEVLESDVMDQVLSAAEQYDPDMFTAEDVRMALAHEYRTPEDFGRFFLPRHFRCWKRLRSVQRRKKRNISEIPSACSRRSILPITARISVFTADSTAIIRSAGHSLPRRRSRRRWSDRQKRPSGDSDPDRGEQNEVNGGVYRRGM